MTLFWILIISGHVIHGHFDVPVECKVVEKAFIQKFANVNPLTGVPIATEVYTFCVGE